MFLSLRPDSSSFRIDEKFCADVGNAYGEGREFYYFESSWNSEDVSKYILFDENGNATTWRILRGGKQRIRGTKRGAMSGYQYEINFRYVRFVAHIAGDFSKPLKISGILKQLPAAGESFFNDVMRVAIREERFSESRTSFLHYNLEHEGFPEIAYTALNGEIRFFDMSKIRSEAKTALFSLIRAYEETFSFPLNDYETERRLKKRFKWKKFRNGGRIKYEAMMDSLRKQWMEETKITEQDTRRVKALWPRYNYY